MHLKVNKYYRCITCGRTYRCRAAGIARSACGHPLEQQNEITREEYRQIRMSGYRNQDMMRNQNKIAREAAKEYSIPVSDRDDAISIFGKVVGLKKQDVIRLFTEIGWRLYHRRQAKVRAKSQGGSISSETVEKIPPAMDDVMFFNDLEVMAALARGIPHSLRMEMHPKYQEYSYFFSLAIFLFAYCYPKVNYCSQDGLCWLFDGIREVSAKEWEKDVVLWEAEEILRKHRGR